MKEGELPSVYFIEGSTDVLELFISDDVASLFFVLNKEGNVLDSVLVDPIASNHLR